MFVNGFELVKCFNILLENQFMTAIGADNTSHHRLVDCVNVLIRFFAIAPTPTLRLVALILRSSKISVKLPIQAKPAFLVLAPVGKIPRSKMAIS
jgi:hypothetical protein